MNIDTLFLPVRRRPLARVPVLLGQALRIVWRAARRPFAISSALQLAAGAGLAIQVLAGQQVLSLLLGGGEEFVTLLPWLGLLAGVTVVVAFANLARIELQRTVSELVGRHATDQVLDVVTTIDLIDFERSTVHDRITRAAVNAASRPPQMASGLLGLISGLMGVAGLAVALLLIEPLFLGLVLGAYVPAWIAVTKSSRVIYDFTLAQTERDRRRSYLFYLLTNRLEAAEVRAYELAEPLRQRHGALYDERIADVRASVTTRLRWGLVGTAFTAVLTAAVVSLLVWWVTTGRLPVSGAAAAAAGLVLLGQRLQQVTASAGALFESSLFLEDFTSFLDVKRELDAERPSEQAPRQFESIRLEDVGFTYPSRDEPSLHGVSLQIHRGEVIALVGENGSGKTTLAKLMAGLYQPSTGRVLWDDRDLAFFDPDSIRRSVAVIFQDYVKYLLSVRDNIALGRHDRGPDEAAVIDAAIRAGADSFIRELPRGYDTYLGAEFHGGSGLSVGQWQRLALARAYYRDAPLLILDEPTASLDPRSEAALFERIRELHRGRTVVLISHRFSSVRMCDRIFVMECGRVTESGSHRQLVALGGTYAELYALQAAAYSSEAGERGPSPLGSAPLESST